MKWIKSFAAILLVISILVILQFASIDSSASMIEDNNIIDSVIFPHDEVIDVNIIIDEDVYEDMINNAISEEIVMADITYNGCTFSDIGIRPKGNSSLRDVYNSDSDRYSFKVDFNYYIENQDFYGITKINLNNIFSDPSMMAEYLGYEMLNELDAVSSRTTYVALSINGEYFGLYLAVEQVNESFITENYGNCIGELYKPDMGIGSNLEYISDEGMDYTGLYPENINNYDNKKIVELIKTIEDGGDLDSVLNVDSFLKYLAMSTMTVHLDSYQGGMYHNYYLYNNEGIFEWITWDLNMAFNGFPRSGLSDDEATQFLIDEPVMGAMENYPLIQAIFENEEYVEKYHDYLEILCEGYLEEDNIKEKVLNTYEMINNYVQTDPTAFYTYEEFEKALFEDDGEQISLLSFIEKRVDNVNKQLSGEIKSTNNGEGNIGTSNMGGKGQRPEGVQGQMPEGMEGQMPGGMKGQRPNNMQGQPPEMMEDKMPEDMNKTNQKVGEFSETNINDLNNGTNTILTIAMAIIMIVASVVLLKKH